MLVTGSTSVVANVAGGALNNVIQGKEVAMKTITKDAIVGAGGAVLGKVAGAAVDKLSPAIKGKIGEAATKVKYLTKGYVSQGKAVVGAGGKTATGKARTAIYDHKMAKKFTGKKITVESKLGYKGKTDIQTLSRNQRDAMKNAPGGLKIDRTTSGQVGNTAAGVATGTTSSQIKKDN